MGAKRGYGDVSANGVKRLSFEYRQIYLFICLCSQDKIKTMEIELDEERSSVELLNDRITRSRDQVPHRNI